MKKLIMGLIVIVSFVCFFGVCYIHNEVNDLSGLDFIKVIKYDNLTVKSKHYYTGEEIKEINNIIHKIKFYPSLKSDIIDDGIPYKVLIEYAYNNDSRHRIVIYSDNKSWIGDFVSGKGALRETTKYYYVNTNKVKDIFDKLLQD